MSKNNQFDKKELKLLNEELNKMRSAFLSDQPKMKIIIDPDDDFQIQTMGKDYKSCLNKDGLFEVIVNIPDGKSVHETLIGVFEGFDFICSNNNRGKVEYLLTEIKKEPIRIELNKHGRMSIGGNNTINVIVERKEKPQERFVKLGGLLIDLKELKITSK